MTKGDDKEVEAKNILKDVGFRVHKKVNNRYDRGDIFGLFDLIASKGDDFKLIQVKSGSTQGCLKEIENDVDFLDYISESISVEVWVRYKRMGWRNQRLTESGWKVFVDERDCKCNIGEKVKEKLSGGVF